jgi:hypothetical protein
MNTICNYCGFTFDTKDTFHKPYNLNKKKIMTYQCEACYYSLLTLEKELGKLFYRRCNFIPNNFIGMCRQERRFKLRKMGQAWKSR